MNRLLREGRSHPSWPRLDFIRSVYAASMLGIDIKRASIKGSLTVDLLRKGDASG